MLPSLSVMLAGSMPCGGHRAERERPGATGRLADQPPPAAEKMLEMVRRFARRSV